MASIERLQKSLELESARTAFHPRNLGFRSYGSGWEKDIAGAGTVGFTFLGWEHGRATTTLATGEDINVLELMSKIQKSVFGMKDNDTLPPYLLSKLATTGGGLLVAYDKDKGFTEDGWLGFGVVLNGKDEVKESILLGVKESQRGTGIGFNMRLLQAHNVLEDDATTLVWSQNPLRAPIANLSLRRLGAKGTEFIPAKHPYLDYKLYGESTSDRITMTWDLLDKDVHKRVKRINEGTFEDSTLEFSIDIPIVTSKNISETKQGNHDIILYKIPYLADTLNADAKREWRDDMVTVFTHLLDSEQAYVPTKHHIAFTGKINLTQDYLIDGFISMPDSNNEGKINNYYVLKKKTIISNQFPLF